MSLKFKFKHLNFHRFHYTLLFYLLNLLFITLVIYKKILTITPMISSFDKMSVQVLQDKPEQGFTTGTGSHDKFSPEQLPTQTKSTIDNNVDMPSDKTYVGKVSIATISANNVVASKLGYGEKDKGGRVQKIGRVIKIGRVWYDSTDL